MNAMTNPAVEWDKVFRFNSFEAEAILASVSENSPPIYTVRLRYWRALHGEIMTHRVFNRNARSSRAVPVAKMIAEVRDTPFVPWHWGKNQKGMQASEECSNHIENFLHTGNDNDQIILTREEGWVQAANSAADHAQAYSNAGYHKQLCNRILEPFSFIDTLITATDWNNFFHLRDHADAEPHFGDLARIVKQAIDAVEPDFLGPDQWHLPYITNNDFKWAISKHGPAAVAVLRKISAARCARISYAPFDGNASYEAEIERYDMLVGSSAVHASPLEHQASPDRMSIYRVTKTDDAGFVTEVSNSYDWDNPKLHGSLRGWVQHRKLVPNEAVYG